MVRKGGNLFASPVGDNETQLVGHHFCVLSVGLVEVACAEEQQRVAVLGFHLIELLFNFFVHN